MLNVFIIGSKGIPSNYGGFETFVEHLTKNKKDINIKYHVSCLADNDDEFEYNGARCFNVKVKEVGSAKAVLYDIESIKRVSEYIHTNKLNNSIVYILACRIGPFMSKYKEMLNSIGVPIIVNPDGHEWKRSKWNYFIRRYWKLSEKLMVKNSNLLICDSKGIESYIKNDYSRYKPNTTYIAYGSDISKSSLRDDEHELIEWYKKNNIQKNQYYLIVGRFVPENNYETMIKEFMKTKSEKDLVIISNVEQNKFYDELLKNTKFDKDNRIKFVGTVYDQELLKKVRENAYAYIHGHEVGGTNPSLLEALSSTKLNILLDVVFNKEVGGDGAIYFDKENNMLSEVIYRVENLSDLEIKKMSDKAMQRIKENYTWDFIVEQYENLFNKYNKNITTL